MEKKIIFRKRVDINTSPTDFQCVKLGLLGQSTKCIQRETALTKCQVQYTLKKYSVSRADYRDGKSFVAESLIDRAKIEQEIKRKLREQGIME